MAEVDSYRYERKFLIAAMDAAQARSILLRHRALFGEPYPPRYVNNIYLDTYEFDNYGDNLMGATERLKVRVRWYHDLFRYDTEGQGYSTAPVSPKWLHDRLDYMPQFPHIAALACIFNTPGECSQKPDHDCSHKDNRAHLPEK